MRLVELLRCKRGEYAYFECKNAKDAQIKQRTATSAACHVGASCTTKIIHGFDSSYKPVHLLRVQVVKPGRPRDKRGRK